MSDGLRSIGFPGSTVKIGGAALLVILTLAIPIRQRSKPPRAFNVAVVIVQSIDIERRTLRGPERIRCSTTREDRAEIAKEVSAFTRRVTKHTDSRLAVRVRTVEIKGPLRTISGPGPHWLTPRDVAPLLVGRLDCGKFDTIMVFVKVGNETGPAVPVSHLGAAYGGNQGLDGACFAGITWRPGWIDGSGTTALHEWLHGLQWLLTCRAGFPALAFPDPDEGRKGPTCCPGAPRGDGPYADHLLKRHLTPAMIRRIDAGITAP